MFAYKYVLDPEGTMQKLQEEAIMMFAGMEIYERLEYDEDWVILVP